MKKVTFEIHTRKSSYQLGIQVSIPQKDTNTEYLKALYKQLKSFVKDFKSNNLYFEDYKNINEDGTTSSNIDPHYEILLKLEFGKIQSLAKAIKAVLDYENIHISNYKDAFAKSFTGTKTEELEALINSLVEAIKKI